MTENIKQKLKTDVSKYIYYDNAIKDAEKRIQPIKEKKKQLEESKCCAESKINYEKLNAKLEELISKSESNKKALYAEVYEHYKELKEMKGIGKGTIDRINEIIKTGKLKEIKITNENSGYLKTIEEMEKIFGIGRKTAYELFKKPPCQCHEHLRLCECSFRIYYMYIDKLLKNMNTILCKLYKSKATNYLNLKLSELNIDEINYPLVIFDTNDTITIIFKNFYSNEIFCKKNVSCLSGFF